MKSVSWVKEQLKIAAEQRKHCRELYSDWEDDEFNCADNKFIWGISHQPNQIASFCTLNYIQVYYNRQYKLYYLDLDLDMNPSMVESVFGQFAAYIYLEGGNVDKKLSLEEVGLDLFSAQSLEDLFAKFKIFTYGYIDD